MPIKRSHEIRLALFAMTFAAITADAAEKPLEADVVVYGHASGAVIAAEQAHGEIRNPRFPLRTARRHDEQRLGLERHWQRCVLGGLSREFCHRLYLHYQKPEAWKQESREKFSKQGQGVPALNPKTELASTFEPKVAEAMVAEAGCG